MNPTLAVLGAGAKAVAVAAKASVLRDMGVDVPDVIAVERIGVGANWQASGAGPTEPTGWAPAQKRMSVFPTGRRWCHGATQNWTSG
ncbi:lysine-N-oxygenase [Mycobacterium tuberculosis]|nr:lysine-N-oxygenase [Mycobacterium tuberculosis]